MRETYGENEQSLASWQGRAILLMDLDAFFASVEQLDHPQWRGKPVIVGGHGPRDVVSTCSYEARSYGVHSAMPGSSAAKLCPDAIWTPVNMKRYAEMSRKVMDILFNESPLMEQVSIDEAFLDVSPGRYSNEDPQAIARRIQERVFELGITCSIGLGSSKSVAKIASEMNKPKGITVVFPGREESFLAPLPVRSLWGIGAKAAEGLDALGIRTLGQVATSDPSVLHNILGSNTQRIIDCCRGIDHAPLQLERECKSISSEMTFKSDLQDRKEIESAIKMLAAKTARRLRTANLSAHTVILKAKYADMSLRSARKQLPFNTDLEDEFIPRLFELVPQLCDPGCRIRLLGVGVSGFDEKAEQLFLLDESSQLCEAQKEERRRLRSAGDAIKDKFGEGMLKRGSELRFSRDEGDKPSN